VRDLNFTEILTWLRVAVHPKLLRCGSPDRVTSRRTGFCRACCRPFIRTRRRGSQHR